MAKQKGCKTFYLVTNEDSKLIRLKARWPVLGKYVWIELLSQIYGHEGYYMKWDLESAEIFAGSISVKLEKVRKILSDCLDLELFDKRQFETNAVLTSAAIQRQYCEYYGRAKQIELKGCFLCDGFNKNVYKNLKIVTDSAETVTDPALIKCNQMKCNEIIDDVSRAHVDWPVFRKKLDLEYRRMQDVYGIVEDTGQPNYPVLSLRKLHSLVDTFRGEEAESLNSCTDDQAMEIYAASFSLYGPESDPDHRKAENKEGYLRTTIKNILKGRQSNG